LVMSHVYFLVRNTSADAFDEAEPSRGGWFIAMSSKRQPASPISVAASAGIFQTRNRPLFGCKDRRSPESVRIEARRVQSSGIWREWLPVCCTGAADSDGWCGVVTVP